MELEINPRTIDQILILDCAGRMVSGEDLHSAKEAVKQLVSTTTAVVVNLEAVSYVEMAGAASSAAGCRTWKSTTKLFAVCQEKMRSRT
jgi:anti-anti-sigma regulatory factor